MRNKSSLGPVYLVGLYLIALEVGCARSDVSSSGSEAHEVLLAESTVRSVPSKGPQANAAGDQAKSLLETLVPPDDANATEMLSMDRSSLTDAVLAQQPPANNQVPRILHRVLQTHETLDSWLHQKEWQDFAFTYGYELKVWPPGSIQHVTTAGPLSTAIDAMLQANRSDVAQQLTGLYALQSQGGILFGSLVSPPAIDDTSIDLSSIMSFHGVTAATNLHARTVSGHSFYLTTAWLASPPRDAWLSALASLAAKNCLHLKDEGHIDWPSRYFAGNAFVSRNAIFPIQLLPFTYLQQVGMFPAIAESEDDAL